MNLAAKTKKLLAIGTAGLLVLAVAFVAALVVLIRQAPAHLPTITAYADGRAVVVDPFLYCLVNAPLCESEGVTTVLQVSEHSVLQLSLPSQITSAPWIAAAVYAGEGSDIVETDTFYLPGKKLQLSVPPVDDDGRELLGVEIRLPSGIIDADTQQEEIISHAIWSIATVQSAAN